MRHPFITAQLLRQARTATSTETSSPLEPDGAPDRLVRRLLLWSAVAILVAVVALGVPPSAGATHAQVADEPAKHASERTLAREHHGYPGPADQAAKLALIRTLAREHHAVPAVTG
jgi:hypothetical protein